MRTAFEQAVANIGRWGDTDVFPLPPENFVLFDEADRVVDLLIELHDTFGEWQHSDPPVNESALAMVGYTSFRWVTQLDPLWNAYLLGLVLHVAADIEQARIPREQAIVFSYRYDYDPSDHRLFAESAWRDFNMRSLELAKEHSHVLVCDIADFYARIYHHRLHNSLSLLPGREDVAQRIDKVLRLISGGISYGLPVGGPAARLLSELLLNRVDRLLLTDGIVFCRFADDYHIFADSHESAHDALRFLTEKLLQNEGLTLQRAKTRILTSKDFIAGSSFRIVEDSDPAEHEHKVEDEVDGEEHQESDDSDLPEVAERHTAERRFLSLSLRYDPYSPTAEEDYWVLREQVEKFDITGMLARELSKTRIHSALTRRLLQAIRYLDPVPRQGAARSLLENVETLAPVFPNVMRVLTDVYDDLDTDTQEYVQDAVRSMIAERRYYVEVPVNLGYAVRLLGHEASDENQSLLAQIFPQAPHFVQRDIVLIMGRWRAAYWLSDQRTQFSRMHPWVQRAFLVCSYLLGDEGEHWRRRTVSGLPRFDALVNSWAGERSAGGNWDAPL